ncbi:MAG TPA: hypothetical protein VGK24_10685 [Candidatus Angelobacter sp.]|jgi:hypothetical protein
MPLTSSFCEHVVVNATPFPSRFEPGTAAQTTLFTLGVVDNVMAAHFVHSIKNAIAPLSIDNEDILSSADTTVQAAADSVQQNAF